MFNGIIMGKMDKFTPQIAYRLEVPRNDASQTELYRRVKNRGNVYALYPLPPKKKYTLLFNRMWRDKQLFNLLKMFLTIFPLKQFLFYIIFLFCKISTIL